MTRKAFSEGVFLHICHHFTFGNSQEMCFSPRQWAQATVILARTIWFSNWLPFKAEQLGKGNFLRCKAISQHQVVLRCKCQAAVFRIAKPCYCSQTSYKSFLAIKAIKKGPRPVSQILSVAEYPPDMLLKDTLNKPLLITTESDFSILTFSLFHLLKFGFKKWEAWLCKILLILTEAKIRCLSQPPGGTRHHKHNCYNVWLT